MQEINRKATCFQPKAALWYEKSMLVVLYIWKTRETIAGNSVKKALVWQPIFATRNKYLDHRMKHTC